MAKPRTKRVGARAQLRAMALAGPVVASIAAEEIGVSASYIRRELRKLEGEGIFSRQAIPEACLARTSLLRTLASNGGDWASAEGLARVSGCGVAHARKVLRQLEATPPVASAGGVVECQEAREAFSPRLWRITDEGADWAAAQLAQLDAEAAEAEAEADLSRRSANPFPEPAFDLF